MQDIATHQDDAKNDYPMGEPVRHEETAALNSWCIAMPST